MAKSHEELITHLDYMENLVYFMDYDPLHHANTVKQTTLKVPEGLGRYGKRTGFFP